MNDNYKIAIRRKCPHCDSSLNLINTIGLEGNSHISVLVCLKCEKEFKCTYRRRDFDVQEKSIAEDYKNRFEKLKEKQNVK